MSKEFRPIKHDTDSKYTDVLGQVNEGELLFATGEYCGFEANFVIKDATDFYAVANSETVRNLSFFTIQKAEKDYLPSL